MGRWGGPFLSCDLGGPGRAACSGFTNEGVFRKFRFTYPIKHPSQPQKQNENHTNKNKLLKAEVWAIVEPSRGQFSDNIDELAVGGVLSMHNPSDESLQLQASPYISRPSSTKAPPSSSNYQVLRYTVRSLTRVLERDPRRNSILGQEHEPSSAGTDRPTDIFSTQE